MDLTPKSKSTPCWGLFNCCRPPASSSDLIAHNQELQRRIGELTIKNQELEANVASLSKENAKFASRLEKDKKKKTDRRTMNRSKIAKLSEKLKEDFGDEFDEFESSLTTEKGSPPQKSS
mmetsp:Transcript_31405/g.66900  ORF Transcript_31405/g.66900 Transcript_31405/m.66900 type:complete len:120 (+) Transcript_31405:252-611(+)|eukprot:CAMPEP_0172570286 /NCGR_PEP_ID=MMETSP1067-20121228/126984_1 /TAXON_ID=265564 ORGANISM="Thalassiosira punctigera, Strain Tpunct2005C2" /NCGR_SAMPLE_ID=MMETSP1067 /ASSEMBLY_ACC=CAM_ASM_000444 /LENGTH=119 /DNA_ID=CAMNT_0013362343 /DNA_START=201 /DNA_END=560 /DNA_ORIENTATION=-